MLRRGKRFLCGDGDIYHQRTPQITRKGVLQESMERVSSCTGFGEKMAQYMSRNIDFDTVDYEEEND